MRKINFPAFKVTLILLFLYYNFQLPIQIQNNLLKNPSFEINGKVSCTEWRTTPDDDSITVSFFGGYSLSHGSLLIDITVLKPGKGCGDINL